MLFCFLGIQTTLLLLGSSESCFGRCHSRSWLALVSNCVVGCVISDLVSYTCMDLNSNVVQLFNMSPNDYDKFQMNWYRLMRLSVRLDICCFEAGNECITVPGRAVWSSVAPAVVSSLG